MKKIKALMPEAYDFNGKLPLKQAIPLGLQHVMAMFVGNLTPLLIITGACGIGAGSEYASIQVALLQNAMIIAGIVTLILNWTCWWQGTYYYGYKLRIYWSIQQCYQDYGWWNISLWCNYGSIYYRWSF
jgi:xanthine/uracil permease